MESLEEDANEDSDNAEGGQWVGKRLDPVHMHYTCPNLFSLSPTEN